jgi:hypothetical protein
MLYCLEGEIMMKKIAYLIIGLAFALSACAAAASRTEQFLGEPALKSLSGRMDGEMAVEEMASVAGYAPEPALSEVERLVIKNADLTIVVKNPAQTMDAISRMAEEMGGFVVSSNLYQTVLESGVEVPRASITIRVPVERLSEALAQIKSGAGQVLSENISGQDVTQEYTDLQSRLRNLEQAEAQLSEIMASATETEDVLRVYSELNRVREQIEVLKGQIQYYEQSAALSAISVDIIADAAVQPLTIGGWQPVGVAKDAIQALINTLKFLANVAPVALVIYLPARGIWLLVCRLWNRRRKGRGESEKK